MHFKVLFYELTEDNAGIHSIICFIEEKIFKKEVLS